MLLLLQLTLAHLLSVFVLQLLPKSENRFLGLLTALAIRVIALLVSINISMQPDYVGVLIVSAVFLASVEITATKWIENSWLVFLAAQIVQAAIILIFWNLLESHDFTRIEHIVTSTRTYIIAVTYVGAILGGGELVRRVCVGFLAEMKDTAKPGLPNAGKYIGWLERFLIVTFVLSGTSEAIGFLIGAKTLVRFPEMQDKSNHFPEYFLVGTLTSV